MCLLLSLLGPLLLGLILAVASEAVSGVRLLVRLESAVETVSRACGCSLLWWGLSAKERVWASGHLLSRPLLVRTWAVRLSLGQFLLVLGRFAP